MALGKVRTATLKGRAGTNLTRWGTVASTPDSQIPMVLPTAGDRPSASAGAGPASLRHLFAVECSLDTTTADSLESVLRTVTRDTVGEWMDRFPSLDEVALLSTCHRVEVFLVARGIATETAVRASLPGIGSAWITRWGDDAVRHLFRVAAGRESSAPGESEVRAQVRTAGSAAIGRIPRSILRDLFRAAAITAEEVGAPGGTDSPSIASVASSMLRPLLPRPSPRVVVVGAGTVGRQVVREITPFARVTLVYHARPPDPEFLRAQGIDAWPLARLGEAVREADAVVTAAKFGDRGLHAEHLAPGRPRLLVDLGMPRNIDPGVRALPGVRLIDLEELHQRTRAAARPDRADDRILKRATEYAARLRNALELDWVDGILRAAESTRRDEIEIARSFLGPLEPDQAIAVDRLTRRLVARLLVPALDRIRALPPGPDGDLRRRIAQELLGPSDPEP